MAWLIAVGKRFYAKQIIPCAFLPVSLEQSFKQGTKELFAEGQQENRAKVVVFINSRANIEEEGAKEWQVDEEMCMARPGRVGSIQRQYRTPWCSFSILQTNTWGTSDYKKNYK